MPCTAGKTLLMPKADMTPCMRRPVTVQLNHIRPTCMLRNARVDDQISLVVLPVNDCSRTPLEEDDPLEILWQMGGNTGNGCTPTLVKPIAFDFSLKHCRHISRPLQF